MPAEVLPLKYTDNATLLDAINHDSSLDYQNRIPLSTTGGVQQTIEALHNPTNRRMFNEFLDSLVNRIGLTIARNNSWTNPLAQFKRGMLTYGSTIQEIQTGLLTAHEYDPDREYMERTLFGTERPQVETNFHTVNRQNFYKISVNNDLLRRAFLEPDGLSSFVSQLMEAPSTSDNWDEFLLTCSLFSEYERNGGFYHVKVPEISAMESNSDDAKVALRKMRAMAGTLQFLSTKYNAAKMPMSAKPEDLVIFTTPEFNAAIDVEALAAAFHIDRAQIHGKIVTIPREHFGINGCEAIMTTKDFFVIADNLLENQAQWNPAALQNNYFLHHWEVISASRFVPAVMFNTTTDDEQIVISMPAPTGVTVDYQVANQADPKRGEIVGMLATVEPSGASQSVKWSVSGNESPRTFITQYGVLHVGTDETADSVTVKAATSWIDPDNARNDSLVGTKTITLSGPVLETWPSEGAIVGISIKGVDVAGFAPGTLTYSVALDSGETIKASDVDVYAADAVSASTKVVKVSGGYTVTITTDIGTADAPVVYTVNVTN